MSSATSIEEPGLSRTAPPPRDADHGLRPWQFFLLAGMLSATAVVLVGAGQSPASIIVLSLTVVAASFVALGTYHSLAPLVSPEAADPPPLIVGSTRAALEREKTLVLRSIKELEFDHAMRKIAKNDFEEMSGRLRARAIGLMKQLDAGDGYRDVIERELAHRGGVPPAPAALGSQVEPALETTSGRSLTICTCGTANDADARFCKNCGNKLAAA